jgi:hypothetical protein
VLKTVHAAALGVMSRVEDLITSPAPTADDINEDHRRELR